MVQHHDSVPSLNCTAISIDSPHMHRDGANYLNLLLVHIMDIGICTGKRTKAHGIRHNWLSGLRNTLRLELGTIQNGDVGIRHKFLTDC